MTWQLTSTNKIMWVGFSHASFNGINKSKLETFRPLRKAEVVTLCHAIAVATMFKTKESLTLPRTKLTFLPMSHAKKALCRRLIDIFIQWLFQYSSSTRFFITAWSDVPDQCFDSSPSYWNNLTYKPGSTHCQTTPLQAMGDAAILVIGVLAW